MNGDSASSKIDTSAEQGELGELKKRYSSQLTTLKELFPDWSDADLVLAIEEADGDLERTIERISEGKHIASSSRAGKVSVSGSANTQLYRRRLAIQRSPEEGQGSIALQSNKGELCSYRVIFDPRRTRRCSSTWS